jgi:peptidoglycan/LPS O-acetylase OafA/YrhL
MSLTELEQYRGRRLVYLESIRGIAALAVVFHHVVWTFAPAIHAKQRTSPILIRVLLASPLSLLINGPFAVRIFFVLSGFVLSLSYFRKKQPRVLTEAASRRYLRLMLPAFASVIFGWILLKFGWYWNVDAATLMPSPDAWLRRWFRLDRSLADAVREGAYGTFFHFDFRRTLNSNLWTMPVEWAGSLIVFSVLALCGWLQRRFFVYAIVAIIFYAIGWFFLVDFVAGLALCDVFTRCERSDWETRLSPVWPTAALVGGLILGGMLGEWPNTDAGLSEYFVSCWPVVPAILIVGGVAFSSQLHHTLESRAMAFLGEISFPLYLFHMFVIFSLGCWLYVCLRRAAMSHPSSALISAVVCVAISVLLAWALYFILELPTLRVARRVGQWFMHSKSAESPVKRRPTTIAYTGTTNEVQ